MCRKHRHVFGFSLTVFCFLFFAACRDGVPSVVVESGGETAVSTSTVQATPTFTPSSTPTQTKTAVPTSTATPSPTSTPTQTRFPELLLTPGTPPTDTAAYRLVPWSADHAHNLAKLMEDYHEEIGYYFNSPITEDTYYAAFRPASLAYAEARLRYSDDLQGDYWHLGEIANRVMSETIIDSQSYQDLIVTALKDGTVSIDTLVDWFNLYPTGYALQIDSLQPLLRYKSSYLISIYSDYNIGNTTFWLLETEHGFLS